MGSATFFENGGLRSVSIGGGHDLRSVAAMAGGAFLVAGNHGTLARVGPDGAETVAVPTRESLRGLAVRPDGGLALAVGNAGALVAVDTVDWAARQTSLLTPVNLRRAAWHPSGLFCLIVGNDGLAVSWRQGRTSTVGWGHRNLRDVAWRPDGSLALIAGNGALYIYREDGDDLDLVFEVPDGDLTGVAWNEDGTFALVTGYRQVGGNLDERETLAHLVGRDGHYSGEALARLFGAVFVGVSRRPDSDCWWIVEQPSRRQGESRVLSWSAGDPHVEITSHATRFVQMAWQASGQLGCLVGSPRADFWRA